MFPGLPKLNAVLLTTRLTHRARRGLPLHPGLPLEAVCPARPDSGAYRPGAGDLPWMGLNFAPDESAMKGDDPLDWPPEPMYRDTRRSPFFHSGCSGESGEVGRTRPGRSNDLTASLHSSMYFFTLTNSCSPHGCKSCFAPCSSHRVPCPSRLQIFMNIVPVDAMKVASGHLDGKRRSLHDDELEECLGVQGRVLRSNSCGLGTELILRHTSRRRCR